MLFGNNTPNANAIHTVSFVYAHGELEDRLGHDIIVADDPVSFQPGVWPSQVTDDDGNVFPVVVFVWGVGSVGHRHTGLVCLPSDVAALKHAADAFSKGIAV